MNDLYADLHIHSLYSDGVFGPEHLVKKALSIGLSVIAITDHDSVDGIDETTAFAGNNIEVIPAVELSANIGNCDIHILGYYIDHHSRGFIDYLEEFKEYRMIRAKKIVENLAKDGIKIDFLKVQSIAKNRSLGRPHIADVLLECGYVRSHNEAFYRYLGYHCPYYEPKKAVSPRTVIQKIKECGGIPVIAHPGMIDMGIEIIYKLISDGVQGIEVWHPEHTRRQQGDFYEIAMKYGLLVTGGSDFHGLPRGYCNIGDCGCPRKETIRLKDWKGV